jgi:hypothetical protein
VYEWEVRERDTLNVSIYSSKRVLICPIERDIYNYCTVRSQRGQVARWWHCKYNDKHAHINMCMCNIDRKCQEAGDRSQRLWSRRSYQSSTDSKSIATANKAGDCIHSFKDKPIRIYLYWSIGIKQPYWSTNPVDRIEQWLAALQ